MKMIDNLFVLLPGVGAQGGSLHDVVSAFKDSGNPNYIINVSRALLYADSSVKFGESARAVLENYNSEITAILL